MYDSPLPISYYEDIAPLNAAHGIYTVRHIETSQIYIKKVMQVYSLDVYAYLLEHPVRGIPRIYALYEHEGTLTVIEEYIPGNTMQSVLDRGRSYSEHEIINYTTQLCKTLAALHTCTPPIIHRDIKPSNIILTEDDRVVLIDLNAARLDDADSDRDTRLLGTSGYAAPEQYGFGKSSVTADIYAVGILMQILLTGGENAPISGNSQPDARVLTEQELPCSRRLANVIRKCTQLDPNKRYQSADTLARALKGQPMSKRLIAAALVACTVLATFTSIYVYMRNTFGEDTTIVTRTTDASTVTSTGTTSLTDEELLTALVGVYTGDVEDTLVLRSDGLADYYCGSGAEFTELSMSWRASNGTLSIEFPKLHCTVTAAVSDDTSRLDLISDDVAWTDEAFTRSDKTPEEYGHPNVTTYNQSTIQGSDGHLVSTIDGIAFTIPRQYVDSHDDYDDGDFLNQFISSRYARSYEARIILYMYRSEPQDTTPDQQAVIDTDYVSKFVDNVTYGDGHTATVAGYEAYTCPFTGTHRDDATAADSYVKSEVLDMLGVTELETPAGQPVSGMTTVIYHPETNHYISAIYYGTADAYEAELEDYMTMLEGAST